MERLEISKTKDYFTKNNKPLFLLAESMWCAFTNISIEEWEWYLDFRWHQGFNAVQISVLPLVLETKVFSIAPFKLNAQGNFNFYEINGDYFDKAEKMLEMATKKGFVPYLAVTMCNYIPDESEAFGRVEEKYIIPFDALENYVVQVMKSFSKFYPIFQISEDTSFPSDRAKKYYLKVLEIIKSIDPKALTVMHTSVKKDILPDEFFKHVDLYMYQAGHFIEMQDNPYKYAQRYYNNAPIKRPIINTSVCYDGMGYGYKYGRFSEFNIRKSIWQSVLSGAKAGVTYGAHGVWNWYKRGQEFLNKSCWEMPYDRQVAIRLGGAWEATFARWIFETYKLFDIEPKLVIMNEDETQKNEIRMSASNNTVVIYIPYSVDIKINMDLKDYDFFIINLSNKQVSKPRIEFEGKVSIIRMYDFNSDALIIGRLD